MRVEDIIGMVALGIILVAGVLIIANFQKSIGTLGLTGVANTTATTAINNVYTGLQLGAIGHHNFGCCRLNSLSAWSLWSCSIKA
jgi:hypothetical protein